MSYEELTHEVLEQTLRTRDAMVALSAQVIMLTVNLDENDEVTETESEDMRLPLPGLRSERRDALTAAGDFWGGLLYGLTQAPELGIKDWQVIERVVELTAGEMATAEIDEMIEDQEGELILH